MGTEYAVKVFKIRGADAGAFNFLYELSMFTRLINDSKGHINIIKLAGLSIDYLEDETFEAKIIMEYCSKGDL